MTNLKQLLENNATLRKIYLEESTRARRILREYNESEIWQEMPESLRKIAVQTAGKLPDGITGDYSQEDDWLKLPNILTSRINISDFDIPKNVSAEKLASYIEQHRDKLPKNAWYQGSVGNPKTSYEVIDYLNSGRTNAWTLKNIIGYMKLEGDFPDINYDELVTSSVKNPTTNLSIDVNPRDIPSGAPSKNRDLRGGNYTGD
jgi:hypothetical protein